MSHKWANRLWFLKCYSSSNHHSEKSRAYVTHAILAHVNLSFNMELWFYFRIHLAFQVLYDFATSTAKEWWKKTDRIFIFDDVRHNPSFCVWWQQLFFLQGFLVFNVTWYGLVDVFWFWGACFYVICIVAFPISCGDTATGSTVDQAGAHVSRHGVIYSLSVNQSTYVTPSFWNSSSGSMRGNTVYITTDSFSTICSDANFYRDRGAGQCTKLLTAGNYFIIVTGAGVGGLYQLDLFCNNRMSNLLCMVSLYLFPPRKRIQSVFFDFALTDQDRIWQRSKLSKSLFHS